MGNFGYLAGLDKKINRISNVFVCQGDSQMGKIEGEGKMGRREGEGVMGKGGRQGQ